MGSSTSEIVLGPLPVDDPLRRQPDISRAKSLLGWEPKVTLKEGLARTIDYFDRLIGKRTVDIRIAAGS